MYLCGHPNPSGKFCEIACGRLESSDVIVKVESTSTYRTTTSKLEFRKGKYPVGLGCIMVLEGQGETQRHVDKALGCVCRHGGP